jgi:hypothetical protein
MSNVIDLDQLVKDPSLLIELCREVISRIDNGPGDPKAGEKEAQLREIAKAVEKLEKMGVSVPDSLRAEKTRLAADLVVKTKPSGALSLLVDEFEEILKELKGRIKGVAPRKAQGERSTSPKTGRKILREHIIKALKKMGGRGLSSEVVALVGRQLEGKLLPGDMEWRDSANSYAWQHNVHWERFRMTQEGMLRTDSARGYWELNETR